MGFFSDMNQADFQNNAPVKPIVLQNADPAAEPEIEADIADVSGTPDPSEFEEEVAEIPAPVSAPVKAPETKVIPAPAPAKPVKTEAKPAAPKTAKVSNGATIISEETTVSGSISDNGKEIAVSGIVEGTVSGNDVIVAGKVKDGVQAKNTATISGTVYGDVSGKNLSISGCVKGSCQATERVVVSGSDSLVIGDITAKTAEIYGRVKGDIVTENDLLLHGSAVILGNLKASTVYMEKGCRFSGMVEQTSVSVNDSEFDLPDDM